MFFKKKKEELNVSEADKGNFKFQLELRPHVIDNLYTIKLPVEFIPYESDKFRAKTEDGMKTISITNYLLDSEKSKPIINKQFFEKLKLDTYDIFVTEGEYEPYDDLKATDEFIRKSFKVDEETQYYFTSAKIIDDELLIIEFIIREIGEYNRSMQPTLEIINRSIQ
jgi:hypothetical protein